MKKVTKVKQDVEIELRPVEFQPFEAVRHLDCGQYSQVAHSKIYLGYFQSDCCRRFVRAVVKKGMVTRLEIDPCTDGKKAPKEIVKLLNSATLKERRARSQSGLFPMPLAQFVTQFGNLVIEVWTCMRICVFGYCFTCCVEGGWSSCLGS